jgi:hypothetical protein
MESTVKLVKRKKDSTTFDKWWLAFQEPRLFIKEKLLKDVEVLKDKENCRLKFEKY